MPRRRRTIKSANGRRTSSGGRTAAIQPEHKIKLVVKENPKRAKAAKRFDLYRNGMKVAEYEKKVGYAQGLADLRWDAKHKFIRIMK